MARRAIPKWRQALAQLTPAQRHLMLTQILEWQIEQLGIDGDVQFREAEDGDPMDFYWESSGDSLIGNK